MDDLVIETSDLRKVYGEVEAVSGLNLSVPRGSIYGFLGRNGAGKTTTIKMLLGMTYPTSGEIRIFGQGPGVRKKEPRFAGASGLSAKRSSYTLA